VERQSWYELTKKGKEELQKQKALGEVSQTSFANLQSQVVPSTDGKAWASVYGSTVNPFTGKRLVDAMKKAKVTTIILHEGKPPGEPHAHT
jgi:DNA-binding PadR family transcriptional regulator